MMEDEAVFSVLSKCFAPVDETDWKRLTGSATWSEFLDGARRLLQDDRPFGLTLSPLARARKRCPLQEFLSAGEVDALFCPPSFEEKNLFSARHFTGGLIDSALPVESLYSTWSVIPDEQTPFPQAKGLYLSDVARYVAALVESMGLSIPDRFSGCPDHLALELDLVAVMLRSDMQSQAGQFLAERFDWLTAYRMRLLEIGDEARFYIGLIDVLLGIRAQQSAAAMSA
ncbi:MAG: molecular chaperone TorD family protein [Gordonibacter sp.]|nr:molecular chaperone TorD family protein [Gordonibacter sp.]